MTNISYVFFGSSAFSLYVLDELEKAGVPPTIIVTTPDKPAGRGLAVTPTGVKVWANARGIPVLDPAKLDATFIEKLKKEVSDKENLCGTKISCHIVAAYGKIIPQAVLDIPPRGTLNVHPSLLPLYRGATPIQSAMLDDAKKTGVTVMRVDALLDHGPIVAQKVVTVDEWPTYEALEEILAREGGRLLVEILPDWLADTAEKKVKEKEQDHTAATFTTKIIKEDGLIAVDMDDMETFATGSVGNEQADKVVIPTKTQYEIFRKIQAYREWPTAYFFIEKNDSKKTTGTHADNKKIRVKITSVEWRDNHLVIKKVIPEGKKETDFASFIRNNRDV
jgi:methionyl-tRNA formyltransferase